MRSIKWLGWAGLICMVVSVWVTPDMELYNRFCATGVVLLVSAAIIMFKHSKIWG